MKMPEPIELNSPLDERAVWGYSAEQMKQYGRDLLEAAAKECDEQAKKWAKEAARHRPFWRIGDHEARDLERARICAKNGFAIRKLKETL